MAEADDIQELALLDFSGGLNNTLDQTLIKDSELKVATNCFYDLHGAPEKRYGYSNFATQPWALTENYATFFSFGNLQRILALGQTTKFLWSSIWQSLVYDNTATATFTNGSNSVVRASGTAEWLTQIGAGDLITADGITWYTVSFVTDNSTLTLTAIFTGSTTTTTLLVNQTMNPSGFDSPFGAAALGSKVYIGPAGDPTSGASGLLSLDIETDDGFSSLQRETRRVAGSPKMNIMATHKNHIFGCNNQSTTASSRLFWSALLNGDSYPASNFVDVAPNDGSVIRMLVSYNDVLYIFKDNDVYYLTGEAFDPSNPTYALRKIVNPHRVGCINGRTCRVFNGRIIFLGPDNIYAIENGINITPFGSNKIRGSLLSNILPNNSGTASPRGVAEIFDNKYWLFCRDAATTGNNDVAYVLDNNGSWSKHTIAANAVVADITKRYLWFWDNAATKANEVDITSVVTNDAGTAISTTMESRVLGFGDFSKTSHVIDVYVAFKNAANQAATVTLYDDSGAIGTPTTISFQGGSTQAFVVTRIPVDRDTNGFYFKVSDATVSKSFMFFGAIIVFTKDARGSGPVIT